MSMEVSGGVELREDIARMADLLRTSGENGSRACNWILQNAAQPVLEQMLHNASTDPKRRTGTLLRSIKIGRVVKKRSGGYRVTVGIHRKDGGAAYGNPVEFGHGGPHEANGLGGIDRAPKIQVNENAVTPVCIVPVLVLVGLNGVNQILMRRSGILRSGLPRARENRDAQRRKRILHSLHQRTPFTALVVRRR